MHNNENNIELLENIVELGKNILVDNGKKVRVSFITYNNVGVEVKVITNNKIKNAFSNFKEVVLKTKGEYFERGSDHLKALNYIGIKHFFNSEETTTKMVVMFINSDGDVLNDHTDINTIHYLLDRKNIVLNIITNTKYKYYCNYLQKIGSNTNELLKCVFKNLYFHNFILSNTFEKFYDDISSNAVCSNWSEWSACSATCNRGSHYTKRISMKNKINAKEGLYKRRGKSCFEQRNFIVQECFNSSCDHSLDACDMELDLSILLDDSSKISSEAWNKYIIPSIRNMISHLNMGKNLVNVSLTTFSKYVHNWFDFSSVYSKDRDELLIYLGYMRFNFGEGSKNINSALNFIHNNVLNSNTLRPNAKKVVLIISNGDIEESSIKDIDITINKIKNTYKAQIYSICVNNNNGDKCKQLSTSSDNDPNYQFSYSFLNYSDLHNEILTIQKNICSYNNDAYNKELKDKDKSPKNSDNEKKEEAEHASSSLEKNNNTNNKILNSNNPVNEKEEGTYTLVGDSTKSYEEDYLNDNLSRKNKMNFRNQLNSDSSTNKNKNNLNTNRMVFRSVINLNELHENEKNPNSSDKDNSGSNIPNSSIKKKGYHKLINRLLSNLFRKKRKFNIKHIDEDAKTKIKNFIQEAKYKNDYSERDKKEKEIENEFNILLDGIFKDKTDSNNSSIPKDPSQGKFDILIEESLPSDISVSDIYQINRDLMKKAKEVQDGIPEYKYRIPKKETKLQDDKEISEIKKYEEEVKVDDLSTNVDDSLKDDKYLRRKKRSIHFENGFDLSKKDDSTADNKKGSFGDDEKEESSGVNGEEKSIRDANSASSNVSNESSTIRELVNIETPIIEKKEENKNNDDSNNEHDAEALDKKKSNYEKRVLYRKDRLYNGKDEINEHPITINSRNRLSRIAKKYITDVSHDHTPINIENIKPIDIKELKPENDKISEPSITAEADAINIEEPKSLNISELDNISLEESKPSNYTEKKEIKNEEKKLPNTLGNKEINIEKKPILTEESESKHDEKKKPVTDKELIITDFTNTSPLDSENNGSNFDLENINQNEEEGGEGEENKEEQDHYSPETVYKYVVSCALVVIVLLGGSLYYLRYKKNNNKIVRALDSNEFSVSTDIKESQCKEQNVSLHEENSWK